MHTHGGDIYGREVRVDFSANLNFLGMPESVIQAACEGVRHSDHYPDVHCRRLREAIARKDGADPEMILCGNGAADLIFAFAAAERPARALLCAPTFYEYEQALTSVGCQISRVMLREEESFAYSEAAGEDILAAMTPGLDLVVICNPNNPTGHVMEPEILNRILARCRENHIRLLLDECFLDFLDRADQVTAIGKLEEYPELVILRAFTKIYAMAGLRLGYALSSDPDLRTRMKMVRQPWSVSVPAQYAGIAAAGETEYVARFKKLLKIERAWLREQLTALGAECFGSEANYIFFRSEPGLAQKTAERGILIRDCSNYEGLKPGYYRTAVRTREENEILIDTLRQILSGENRR